MSKTTEHTAIEVAEKLLQIKAIKLSPQKPFTWSSGLLSPIYCDNRTVLSHPEIRSFIKKELAAKAAAFGPFDLVAGVATAGIPHGVLLADLLELPFVYVRSQPKAHGRKNRIEGSLAGATRVLVVEDLISTGGSSLRAVEALREEGLDVAGVLAIFTYGFEKAVTAFQTAKCPFLTLSDYDTLLETAYKNQFLSLADLDLLQRWRTETGSN